MNHIDIFHNSWIYDTGANIYITCILDEYIKDKDTGPDDYVAVGEKPVKIDLYRTSIIIIDILNDPDTIILADIIYCFIFLANVISVKYF